MRCDRHGRELTGESPAIALERRREYAGKGKGARRNFPDLSEKGLLGDGKPIMDLKGCSGKSPASMVTGDKSHPTERSCVTKGNAGGVCQTRLDDDHSS